MNVEPQPGRKFVWYYGYKLEIPKDHYYVATDKNGMIWSYKYHPMKNTKMNCWDIDDETFKDRIWQYTGEGDYELAERWQATLVEYHPGYKFRGEEAMKNNDPLNDPVYRKRKIARRMLKFYVKFLAGNNVITDENEGLCINNYFYVKRQFSLMNIERSLIKIINDDYNTIWDKIFEINSCVDFPIEGDAEGYHDNKTKYEGEFLKMRHTYALRQIEILSKLIREGDL